MNIDKNNFNNQNELTVGLGALTGATGAYALTRVKNNSLAKSALRALNGSSKECDAFIAQHEGLMKKSITSKKGFFGKLNNILRETKETALSSEDIKKGTQDLLGKYKDKAIKTLTKGGKTPLDAEISALEQKYITRDLSKTFRNASKLKSALIISSAALFSAVAFSAIKEISLDISAKRLLKKTENEVKNAEKDVQNAKESGKEFEYYPEGNKKPPVKSVH